MVNINYVLIILCIGLARIHADRNINEEEEEMGRRGKRERRLSRLNFSKQVALTENSNFKLQWTVDYKKGINDR
jgi:hypothetical protein